MDPRLFDILWEVYREAGSSQPIDVLSAYRSPQTNAMLRRRSRLVAEKSQHMEGQAPSTRISSTLASPRRRDVAMRMQEGGVGFYPIGNTPWVHIDSGTVRYWPRMSRAALARLFPDGKTVFIPADGQPMERYADAKAMIEARGGDVQIGEFVPAACSVGCSAARVAAARTTPKNPARRPSSPADAAARRWPWATAAVASGPRWRAPPRPQRRLRPPRLNRPHRRNPRRRWRWPRPSRTRNPRIALAHGRRPRRCARRSRGHARAAAAAPAYGAAR